MPNIMRFGVSSEKNLTLECLETSQVWTVPSGVHKLWVWMCGGGASGAVPNTTSSYEHYFFGGSSGVSQYLELDVTPGQEIPAVIGAGGVGDNYDGGMTSFGDYLVTGGRKGQMGTSLVQGAGSVYGNFARQSKLGSSSSGVVGNGDPKNGKTDAGYKAYYLGFKGFCPLDGEIYCGGGATGPYIYGASTSSSSVPESATIPGGGGIRPAYTATWTKTGGITSGGVPTGGDGTKYGAGGCSGGMIETPYASVQNLTSASGNGHSGVVIIGY